MYRRSFEYQRTGIPKEYCGWAAERNEEKHEEKHKEALCEERTELLPAPCGCGGGELTDYLIIGAVILLVLSKGRSQKPDIALLVGLAFLLFNK
ncbi:MAG: hypothetical protein IKB35_04445 [Clostridia bacterium]|nr:hypothetical protein [Clostridia bacterium]MBR6742857.1 hypothetical protein [Clostridia bacterium]